MVAIRTHLRNVTKRVSSIPASFGGCLYANALIPIIRTGSPFSHPIRGMNGIRVEMGHIDHHRWNTKAILLIEMP